MVYVVKFIVEGPQLIRFVSKYMFYNYKSESSRIILFNILFLYYLSRTMHVLK